MTMGKFITFGEIMLWLTPPDYGKIRVANSFEVNYGGSEANIALALANLGVDSTFFSVVPDNSLGKSAVRLLRANEVHCTPVILSTEEETPSHRLGTIIWRPAMAYAPVKSPMTGGTVPSRNTIFLRWIWMGCWKDLTGST